METNRKSFKKMFPNLSEELKAENSRAPIDAIRTDPEAGEKVMADKLRSYDPTVVDFIRRCDTEEQAEEIIAYMEEKGEVNREHAAKLRKQLKEKGVRSFGSKKEENYYFKQGGIC